MFDRTVSLRPITLHTGGEEGGSASLIFSNRLTYTTFRQSSNPSRACRLVGNDVIDVSSSSSRIRQLAGFTPTYFSRSIHRTFRIPETDCLWDTRWPGHLIWPAGTTREMPETWRNTGDAPK